MIAQDGFASDMDALEAASFCRDRIAYFESRLAYVESLPNPTRNPFYVAQAESYRASLRFWRGLLRDAEHKLAVTVGSGCIASSGPQGPAMDGRITGSHRQDAGGSALGLVSFRHK